MSMKKLKMGKTKLSLDDIEEIKKSKDLLSASEVQKKYNICWSRLQKIWDANPVRITKEPQENIVPQESIIQQELIPQHREIVVEDFYARLGQTEAKMERQTELMQNILDSLDAVSDIESDTQSILEKENKEFHTFSSPARILGQRGAG